MIRPLIEIKDLSYRQRRVKVPALDHVDLYIGKGEFVVITGWSGCWER
jgi:energy-coupling factor transporter ATP-binding protein EcfA2